MQEAGDSSFHHEMEVEETRGDNMSNVFTTVTARYDQDERVYKVQIVRRRSAGGEGELIGLPTTMRVHSAEAAEQCAKEWIFWPLMSGRFRLVKGWTKVAFNAS